VAHPNCIANCPNPQVYYTRSTRMERKRARNWYWWLWLSPLVTLPSLSIVYAASPGYEWVCPSGYVGCNRALAQRVTIAVAVLISGLWHLILLIPALNQEHPFVRWHGRQALLLAGVRTAVPLVLGLAFGESSATLLFVPLQIAVWLGGTLWGQRQAVRGDCSLMRWAGQGELLASLQSTDPVTEVGAMDPGALVEIIRNGIDSEQRKAALRELERRRMVESL
jgi:hypothetical protein